ncbi:MAG: ubiquitin-conjugating enzyme E2 [Thermoplasmata archaeon]
MPKLPLDILQMRLKSELEACRRELKHTFEVSDETFTHFPITISVTMRGVPGPIYRDGTVSHLFTHNFTLKITDEYPYQKPIVIWESEIFHPNIMEPEEGGLVCSKLLDEWDFRSNLLKFILGLETLLSNPNPANAYITESCTEAAKFFTENPYKPPAIIKDKGRVTAPKIVGAK